MQIKFWLIFIFWSAICFGLGYLVRYFYEYFCGIQFSRYSIGIKFKEEMPKFLIGDDIDGVIEAIRSAEIEK